MKRICLSTLTVLVTLTTSAVVAQMDSKNFTYDQAYPRGRDSGPSLTGQVPNIRSWLDDRHYLELRREEQQSRLFSVDVESGQSALHRDYAELGKNLPEGLSLTHPAATNADESHFILQSEGDLYSFDIASRKLVRLSSTAASEENPIFSPDGRWIAYTRNRDLYAYDLEDRLEIQLTSDATDTVYNGWASWVYFEEILGRRGGYRAFWWSPDSRSLAYLRFDDSPVPEFPIYHADGQHGELEVQRYPKAGDPNPYVSLGVVRLDSQKTVWMDFVEKADHYLAWPFWTHDSRKLTIQWMNRGQDTIRLYNCDPTDGSKTLLLEERQDSWVSFFKDLYHFKDGSGFLLRSDVDGWSHLYLYRPDGKLRRRLTSGDWRVNSISSVDEKNGIVYFIGRPGKTWDAQLMRISLEGGQPQRLTTSAGVHRAQVSPAGSYFIDTVNTIEEPSRVSLHRGDGALLRELGNALTDEMAEYAWGKAELFTIPSGDGYDLPAYWVLPPNFDRTRRYPVLFSIYGGPDAGRVRNSWLGIQPHYWAQQGVITISVDHRASGHFGKKGVALMHRNLGKWEMHDLTAAAQWLRRQPFVDPTKIGITGGSYGGYTTLMALTRAAQHFNFGDARSSVSDWRLYDTVYTERYMDTPRENPEGYEEGAVSSWIEHYQGGLRITHGTIDDNVHMQNSIQIVDWLTSHDKEFELMLYPDSRHGFQSSQRIHSNRASHSFWMRVLLGRGGMDTTTEPE